MDTKETRFFTEEFKKLESTYVADGHHRTAAAFNVGKLNRQMALGKAGKITGEEDFNYFMSILYPASQLQIMDYNRVVTTLNGIKA